MTKQNKLQFIKQDMTLIKSLAIVFIPIFIVLITISIIQNDSLDFLEEKYINIHNSSYSGKITSLLLKENNGSSRPILIDDKWEKQIPFFIHEKLNIGDSLFKKSKSDFEYYVKKSNYDTIKRDVNKFYRKNIIINLMKNRVHKDNQITNPSSASSW